MSNVTNTSFENFFLEGWLVRQQQYLDQLLGIQEQQQHENNQDQLRGLVERVLIHYQQYYQAKDHAIQEDVFLLFAPPWFSPYERTFLWIAGFKPSLLYRLVNKSVTDLSEEQVRRIERLKVETRTAERQMNDEQARVQESLSAANLVRMATTRDDGETNDEEEEFRRLREAMKELVKNADLVRMTTAKDVVEALSPSQAVRFLVAIGQLQKKIRLCGK